VMDDEVTASMCDELVCAVNGPVVVIGWRVESMVDDRSIDVNVEGS